MGFRSLPTLLIQTIDGLIATRARVLQIDTTNLTLVQNADNSLTLGATGGGGGGSFQGVSVYKTGAQAMPDNASADAITWDAVVTDPLSMWNIANPARLTIPTGKAGWWRMSGTIVMADPGGPDTYYCDLEVYDHTGSNTNTYTVFNQQVASGHWFGTSIGFVIPEVLEEAGWIDIRAGHFEVTGTKNLLYHPWNTTAQLEFLGA